MTSSHFLRQCRVFAAAVTSCVALAAPLAAQEVRLVSTDGFIDFTGTLVTFEDGVYVIDSNLGRLTLPATEVSCEGEACPQTNQVGSAFGVAGSPTMIRFLMPELLDSYSLDADTDIQRTSGEDGVVSYQLFTFEGDPVAEVSLREATADAAVGDLASGDAALAILPTRMTSAQARRLGTSTVTMSRQGFETAIAADALAVIVNEDVGVEALRVDELAEIFSGDIRNWSDLGGDDLPITVITQARGTDVYAAVISEVLQPLRKRMRPDVTQLRGNADVARAVADTAGGIGIAALSQISADLATVGIANACDFAVQPSEAAIKTGRYPLQMSYHLYSAPSGVPVHARGLVDFASSALGQELVNAAGYFNLGVGILDESDLSYGETTEDAQPLSLALTVGGGAVPLDAADTDALNRLASFIRSGRIEGNEVLFLGITEPGDEDQGLAAARSSLRALFAAHADIEEQLTVAFGIASADATADSAACIADLRNEIRVEIWLRPLPANG